jgi:hypothetical protein
MLHASAPALAPWLGKHAGARLEPAPNQVGVACAVREGGADTLCAMRRRAPAAQPRAGAATYTQRRRPLRPCWPQVAADDPQRINVTFLTLGLFLGDLQVTSKVH